MFILGDIFFKVELPFNTDKYRIAFATGFLGSDFKLNFIHKQ